MTEPKRTVFEDLRSGGNFNFYNDVGKIIKFNSYFSKLGFERVNMKKDFRIHTYYPQLTLMICPLLRLLNLNDDLNPLTPSHLKLKREEVSGDNMNLWANWFNDKKGYIGMNSFYTIKATDEKIEPLYADLKQKKLLLGQYLTERNIVILYINPFYTNIREQNNEYLDLILKTFEDEIKRVALKKVDVSEKMKIALIENFKEEINRKITDIREEVIGNENSINELQISLIRNIKTAQLNRKQIEGLISFEMNTDSSIKKALEEIKELPFVKNVCLTNLGVGMDIGRITINHNDKEVYIGDFYLIISPNGIKAYCKNPILNRENLEIAHPHIDGNNNCYGGEREQKIIEYLSTFELKKLVFFIYMFLKTYTSNDCYNQISMWEREDLRRRKTAQIDNGNDIINASFQGDYFQEKEDNGRGDGIEEDEEDEPDEPDFLCECAECGNSIYVNDDYCEGDIEHRFCSNYCRREYNTQHNTHY